jgi:uncharacterized damage-inducible protein DinB
MRRTSQIRVALFILAISCCGFAQETEKKHGSEKEKPGKTQHEEEKGEITPGTVMLGTIMHLQRTFLPLAMAMPTEKYGYAPTDGEFKGVRTFGQQVKHVAATNYVYASAIMGEKPPADVGEDGEGPASLKTKEEILKYATDSFYYVQKAVVKMNEKNIVSPIKNPFGEGQATRLSMAILIVGHCNDHYGQLVEYLRLNGIVPPASQR